MAVSTISKQRGSFDRTRDLEETCGHEALQLRFRFAARTWLYDQPLRETFFNAQTQHYHCHLQHAQLAGMVDVGC